MQVDPFELEILALGKAEVYLSGSQECRTFWELVRLLDQASIRVVGDLPESDADGERVRRIMAGCAGVVGVLAYWPKPGTPATRPLEELCLAAALDLPLALFVEKGIHVDVDERHDRVRLQVGGDDPLLVEPGRLHGPTAFLDAADALDAGALETAIRFQRNLVRDRTRIRPYAFLVGRLERDFAQAREAVRAAVEREAGLPCLWSDDGRHLTNVGSVRERTRLLIKHASFVIADLTLGFENPEGENPSRAHEIGMAIAYDRPLMLCSQEPRRYPYFSIGDMQMTFWATEAELASCVGEWIRTHRERLGRQVFNHRLAEGYPGYEAQIGRPVFVFDPARRYVGPATEPPSRVGVPRVALWVCVSAILAVLALLILTMATGSR
jgi:hypothetical protein